MYPVKAYFKSEDNRLAYFGKKPSDHSHMGRLIDHRYRKEGYGINWLMFGKKEDLAQPQFLGLSKHVGAREDDKYFSCGFTFREHIKERKYADPDYVLGQIINPDPLVIGGFCLPDCVDKMAKASYSKGLEVRVDDDLTEMFFPKSSLHGEIPLDISPLDLSNFSDFLRSRETINRAVRPWLSWRLRKEDLEWVIQNELEK